MTLTIELHALNLETGVWCDRCLLPSVVRFDWVGVRADNLRPWVRGTSSVCQDCGEDRLE